MSVYLGIKTVTIKFWGLNIPVGKHASIFIDDKNGNKGIDLLHGISEKYLKGDEWTKNNKEKGYGNLLFAPAKPKGTWEQVKKYYEDNIGVKFTELKLPDKYLKQNNYYQEGITDKQKEKIYNKAQSQWEKDLHKAFESYNNDVKYDVLNANSNSLVGSALRKTGSEIPKEAKGLTGINDEVINKKDNKNK